MHPRALTVFVLLCVLPVLARKEETLEQLKARLDTAKQSERVKICVEIAERQVEASDQLFTDGKVDAAHAAVEEVALYAEKAGGTAIESGSRLKDTEIAVRKMSRRLGDIKRSLAFEDQPAVDRVIDRLEDVRTSLLKKMFSKDKKK